MGFGILVFAQFPTNRALYNSFKLKLKISFRFYLLKVDIRAILNDSMNKLTNAEFIEDVRDSLKEIVGEPVTELIFGFVRMNKPRNNREFTSCVAKICVELFGKSSKVLLKLLVLSILEKRRVKRKRVRFSKLYELYDP